MNAPDLIAGVRACAAECAARGGDIPSNWLWGTGDRADLSFRMAVVNSYIWQVLHDAGKTIEIGGTAIEQRRSPAAGAPPHGGTNWHILPRILTLATDHVEAINLPLKWSSMTVKIDRSIWNLPPITLCAGKPDTEQKLIQALAEIAALFVEDHAGFADDA